MAVFQFEFDFRMRCYHFPIRIYRLRRYIWCEGVIK